MWTVGSLAVTLERVDLFVTTAALAEVFLVGGDFFVGTSSDDGVGSPAVGSLSGMSLVPERVVRDLAVVVVVVTFLATVVVVGFTVALGADGGLRRRIGRGMLVIVYVCEDWMDRRLFNTTIRQIVGGWMNDG